MKAVKQIILFTLVITFLCSSRVLADSKGDEIMKQAIHATYYAAEDRVARVDMQLINKRGKVRKRELTMLRKDVKEGGEQKYFMYFHKPADVRGMTYMVYKYPDRNDDRWLYISAIKMIKRIAADDGKSSFVGSDFSYEDVSGRSFDQDDHQLVKSDTMNGIACYLVRNTAHDPESSGFAYRKTWVSEENYLIVKDEYYDTQKRLIKTYLAENIQKIDGFPLATLRTMKNENSGHLTRVTFSKVRFNIALTDKLFSQRSLKRPPRKWLK